MATASLGGCRLQDYCALCGGPILPYRRSWGFRCQQCGVLTSRLDIAIPEAMTAGAIDEAQREEGLAPLREIHAAAILAKFTRTPGLRAGTTLLDVGCGPGFFLAAARAAGFLAEGVEPDANVLDRARATGAEVHHGYFPDALPADRRYEVVTFNDVLEHIPDALGTLRAAWDRLAAGGILCLQCPDKRGLFFRAAAAADRLGIAGAYDRLWQVGLPSPHVWYFDAPTLTRAATSCGFEPVGMVRLDAIALRGLWRRIRYVRSQPLPLSAATFAFSLAAFPLMKLMPSDASALFFRKAARNAKNTAATSD